MIKVVSNTQGTGDWIRVLGHSGSVLWEGHRASVFDLHYILDIVSRDGAELIETNDEGIEESIY
jgi:hypothetical protein